jgi:DNA-binding MarR family transcriptional regulator
MKTTLTPSILVPIIASINREKISATGMAMLCIMQEHGPTRPKDLARELCLTPSGINSAAAPLLTQRLMTKSRVPVGQGDERSVAYQITKKGNAVLARLINPPPTPPP